MSLLSNLKSLLRPNRLDVRARFALERAAISGTMSAFHVARDRQTDKLVGLKLLDPEKTAALEARFVGLDRPSEGEIAARFDHPHIVRTHEHGLTTDGLQYLVMEFVDGPGLNSLLAKRTNELDGKRLSLLRQAAEAVAAVHEAGFIHRDVCPRNFMLSRDLNTLKLIDFGLAVPATPPFMQPGNRTGTPNYMAPELVRRKKADQRLDVFAYGVSMFEMFAYELPWPRGTTGQAAMAHGTEPPADLRKLCPGINPQLAAAIHACLAAEPDQRPATMRKFLELIKDVKSETAG